tara:strand:- start:105 stop:323 length:219 start_codon:yes stop_codon:yes gene_type:complete
MNPITAHSARELSTRLTLDHVMDLIYKQCVKGGGSIDVSASRTEHLVSQLKGYGYQLVTNGNKLFISWRKED